MENKEIQRLEERIKYLKQEIENYKKISNYIIDNNIYSSQDVGEKQIVAEFDKEVIEKLWHLG